jgi:phosphatidylglycerophosphate synthase
MPAHRSHYLNLVPPALTTLRILLAVLMVFLALKKAAPFGFIICLCLALVSDILDGVVARRYNVASAFLRRYDSTADTVFYLSAVYAVWVLYPEALRNNLRALLILLGLELARYAVDLYKFGREASYHMWSAKLWNLTMFAAFTALLGFGFSGRLFTAAVWVGISSDLEGLLATFLLPAWRHDVPTVWHAYRIRKSERPIP